MKVNRVKEICIVGGGTAGWLTAAFIKRNLPMINLTLIESPNIPTVGVGEATILNFDKFLKSCGFEKAEWMQAADAVYKAGIFSPNWRGNDINIWHQFSQTPKQDHFTTAVDLFYNTDFSDESYYQLAQMDYDTCVLHNKIPNADQMAFHLDAVKLANWVSSKVAPHIKHYQENVENVVVEDGVISKIFVTNLGEVTADLFIDCTGFKRLLSGALPGSEYVNKSYCLPNNAAIATPVEYENPETEMKPYTTAQAMEHGWMWKTPIQTRIGSGLVYNRDLLDEQGAIDLFVQHWGEKRLKTGVFNRIKWEPEYNACNWRGNVVSIGLASGFLEPLESTGLALITDGVVLLHNMISKLFYTQTERDIFNNRLELLYDDATDFVGLHYMNNQRSSVYWDQVRANWRPSETLQMKIDLHQEDLTRPQSTNDYLIFGHHSWNIWLHSVGIKGKPTPIHTPVVKDMLINFYLKHNKYQHTKCPTNYEIMMQNKETILHKQFPYELASGLKV